MINVNEKLDKVQVDLWGPHYLFSLSGKIYITILFDTKTRKLWVKYSWSKDEFVDVFITWLLVIEKQSNTSMKTLCINEKGEFISAKLKDFCYKKKIIIKYIAPYIHEENGLAERGWKTIIIMNDFLLVNSRLPFNFWAEAMDTANYLQYCLLIKSRRLELIPEESWIEKKQDVSYFKIFGSLVIVVIPKEKWQKSNNNKN